MTIKVLTEKPVAYDCDDYISQQEVPGNYSANFDNSTDTIFILAAMHHFGHDEFNVLDLGCGGGQLILDFNKFGRTGKCVGLDGVAGQMNWDSWRTHKNKLLFEVDLSADYEIMCDDELLKFDLITSWEMIEHLRPEDLGCFFRNAIKHLRPGGTFIGSIAMFPDTRDTNGFTTCDSRHDPTTKQYELHSSVFNKEHWETVLFEEYEFKEYPFKSKNYKCGYVAPRDHPGGFGTGSYYFCITGLKEKIE